MSEPSSRPKLLSTRKEAAQKIKAQITKGREVLKGFTDSMGGFGFDFEARFTESIQKQEKWAKYNYDLLQSLFDQPDVANEFGNWWIHLSVVKDRKLEEFKVWMNQRIARLESILERLELYEEIEKTAQGEAIKDTATPSGTDIFIVHGHDDAAKESVARFIEQLQLRPIILHEQANQGRTVIEKFEDHSNVGYAVVLLTPDDLGAAKNEPEKRTARPRQNVVFELGYFIGKLGRNRVCALYKEGVDIPSDYRGVLYVSMDDKGAWKLSLTKEIKQAGIVVDLNKVL